MNIQALRLPHLLAGAALMALLPVANIPMAQAHDFKSGDIEVDHPWSRETPPGARVAGGYVTIRNNGGTADRLVAVSADIAGKSEIHEMSVNEQGVMTMRPLSDGVEIPAGGEVALKPGSFHFMFMELKQPPRKGENFAGTLTFEHAGEVAVEFAVEAMGAQPESGHGSGHGQHGG
ncbi:copper chaperone PCu(A)C [Aureimonas fodinaquatilis]|uniref:Copper chaperone PCu(A)C n=1 Tax=Aureimonas fodinaquatilis TaxID=2565783 RepID=A0A5B0E058_9HYPH|nr:copper chaperone PCu(A)C [Aureimonas fodinaquatilis]KAA0972193.1 copper chaperone PCu(A)C [Aureimonas fodinaquatilis]